MKEGCALRRVLLVTGVSGAGRTTTLNALEDLGWETIDNLPVRFLRAVVQNSDHAPLPVPLAIGFDSRTRDFAPAEVMRLVEELEGDADINFGTLFLDCSSAELERRYNETRRRHPMAHGRPAIEGITAERELMEPLRQWSEMIIDTTGLTIAELQQTIRERFDTDATKSVTLTVSSFGFSSGMPPLADFVFDMRFLDNPHWDEALRPLTGLDEAVAEHIKRDPPYRAARDRIVDLLTDLLPRYRARGKSYVHVAFGCTGGRHRSVFTARDVAARLRAAGFSPTVRHRNLTSRTTNSVEGDKGDGSQEHP